LAAVFSGTEVAFFLGVEVSVSVSFGRAVVGLEVVGVVLALALVGSAFLAGGLDFGLASGFFGAGGGAAGGGSSSFLKMPPTLSLTPLVMRLKKPGFFPPLGPLAEPEL